MEIGRLDELVARSGFSVTDSVELPGRRAEFSSIPTELHPRLKAFLSREYPNGLFRHQQKGIKSILEGNDVCLATSTASGKSLVFMTAAANLLLNEPNAKVVALYPARALILDQLKKWQEMMQPLAINVARIDGGVLPVKSRQEIVRQNRILCMTPDVVQAWLMRSLDQKPIASLMQTLGLLILDEAHTYEGVFGTNMAYLLRRFEVAGNRFQMLLSTATLNEPEKFAAKLTGRTFTCIGSQDESSDISKKTLLVLRHEGASGKSLDRIASLVAGLAESARQGGFRFLAFADSRKLVERVVVMTQRLLAKLPLPTDYDKTEAEESSSDFSNANYPVLPYRAGYEEEDRIAIQKALNRGGELAGVVATSAMELGIDIGDIDAVLFLGTPPSMKSFWQRLGRAGRKNEGLCLIIDDEDLIASQGGLASYVKRPLEPNWLYLDNRYIQYSHVLCAASELSTVSVPKIKMKPFESLPSGFKLLLENELDPKEAVESDLYDLKQKALGGPHQEFPLRSAVEMNFKVLGPFGRNLGELPYPYALREAYPGGIYYYMARPCRVISFGYKTGEIRVKGEKQWTTTPNARVMVFPKYPKGVLSWFATAQDSIIETELQVSELVTGFTEQRGPNKDTHVYDQTSPYCQRSLNRFFRTTGVCLHLSKLNLSANTLRIFLEAFCGEFGVQDRDVGIGDFHTKVNPAGVPETQRGPCIFDATNGSLRLTRQLAANFPVVARAAADLAERRGDLAARTQLDALFRIAQLLKARSLHAEPADLFRTESDGWLEVICPGEKGVYAGDGGKKEEVEVKGVRYTPNGAVYDINIETPNLKQFLGIQSVQPIFGQTKTYFWNPTTGETKPKN
jgi:DEAD/DEAH box helicase domain-containing protein